MDIPEPNEVINDLRPILPTIYEALNKGTLEAVDYLEKLKKEKGFSFDLLFAAHITRYHTFQFLKRNGYNVINGEADFEYEMKDIANSGLYLFYNRYSIRIFKTQNGEVPNPGNSITKQLYYSQQQYELFPGITDPARNLNLILLWDVSSTYKLKSLSIACPKSGGKTKESIVMHWKKLIPIEFLQRISNKIPFDPSLKSPKSEIEDLPVYLKKKNEIEIDNKK
jgi:hypothetical protein